ncbi:MAG TPA: hypothetical protein VIC08_02860 [Cellvibrionaceae bacterium]
MSPFPVVTEEMAEQARQAYMGDLAPITLRTACGYRDWHHRLGCECGGEVRHLWKDNSGALLECGVDFSPLPEPKP